MLQMQDIGKLYQTEMVQTQALREFNLTVNEGEFIAVTGPSGSGKTTFLNIAGLLEPFSSGQYMLDGVDVGKLNDNQRSDLRNQKIGFIFQGFNLIPDLNLFENIEVPLRYRGIKTAQRKRRIEQCLEQVGLAGRARHLPQQLSGGQQQRVAIARALAGEPRFLLADEPTGNLDSLMAKQVMTLLEELNRAGTTIVMVTHDQELARRTPRNIQIVDGQVADFTLYQGVQGTRENTQTPLGV
ncbi:MULTISPECIES: ABC transporter ATP-binding protein [Pseudoalteromonas]|uniref:ABC-type antimicrobial peptide transport system, ATPase component n=1 Tax=Pseudoalteromonas luteoviolacea (strain 2ta16) TaxID=1353533 RepID=V4J5Y6_PSEL2|nr:MULTISPECIES: ABC transporter ATP-binding protein [Pseudoalteromonas]ESP90752.1 ABC-type antimicrobial peptide transport system, ATPase component [Pseudoalteromonas luteoviolacea 2ta16]KZN41674.1 phosphonate ABC transporter ATP-binding protein [Pseudoalteromonas luteoviolacea NCIMB 1944]MCG7548165.1 ABC transporter ATP-binding protein [Pseudoalteromonas sp. Of7M-16]